MSTADDRELIIRDLHVSLAGEPDKEILHGLNLTVRKGEVHAIMGRNGSGKTTLAYTLMGHPGYEVTSGEILWKGQNLVDLSADKRARMGLFLALGIGRIGADQFGALFLKAHRHLGGVFDQRGFAFEIAAIEG